MKIPYGNAYMIHQFLTLKDGLELQELQARLKEHLEVGAQLGRRPTLVKTGQMGRRQGVETVVAIVGVLGTTVQVVRNLLHRYRSSYS